MSIDSKHLARFDDFVFDFSEHALQLNGTTIDLRPQTLAILAYLIANRGRLISNAELMAKCWDVSVSIGSVHKEIADIRKALGDAPRESRYVETKPKFGYRFIAEVSEQKPAPALPEPTLAPIPSPEVYLALKWLAIAVVLFITVLLAARVITAPPDVRVIESVPLTADGLRKLGPFVTDGRRIFFREAFGNSFQLVSIPVSGGESAQLEIAHDAVPLFAAPDGSHLILLSFEGGVGTVSNFSRTSSKLYPLLTGIEDAAVSADGQRIASLKGLTLSISSLNGAGRITRQLAEQAGCFRWSMDNRTLRFALKTFAGAWSSSEWELDTHSLKARPLTTMSRSHQIVGVSDWSRSGRYFFFEAGTAPDRDIWVSRELRSRLFGDQAPQQLTNGKLGSWQYPCSDPNDESTIFASNRRTRSDLVRYNSASQTWNSEWESISGEDVSWSKDGQWVTYTKLPDYSIWKSRNDGSGGIRLTAHGFEAHQPHWSPDEKQVAFMGRNSQGLWRVYQVPASGGVSEELFPKGEDQGVPTWSPDGCCLIFGERMTKKPHGDMSIHKLDLASRTLSEIPGSRGLWSPRWSPDGNYVLAVTTDSSELRLWNCASGKWQKISRTQKDIDNASWSPNSQYILFAGREEDKQWLFRFVIATSAIERLLDITSFDTGLDRWFGISPDGSPVAHRDVTIEEIFKLKLALP